MQRRSWVQVATGRRPAAEGKQWVCRDRQKSGQQVPGRIGYSGCRLCGCFRHRAAECDSRGLDRIAREVKEQCRVWGGAIARLKIMKTVEDALGVQSTARAARQEQEKAREPAERQAEEAEQSEQVAKQAGVPARQQERMTTTLQWHGDRLLESTTARAASREGREQDEEKKSGVREDRRRKQNEMRRAGAAKKAVQAARAKIQALVRGEYPTPRPKLEVAKAQAEVKAAEAQRRAAKVKRTRALDNIQWYRGAYQAATSARGRTEPRRKLAIAACARSEADRDIEIAERRKEQALQKREEAAKVVDAERKRAERAKRWREKAKTADRTRKWSRVVAAVQRELHRRQVDSVARVVKEGYWTVVVRRNDSDDEMYESWRRDTHNDDEVYEVQDTFEDHWSGDEIIEILEMQDRGYSRAEAIEIVLHM